MFRLYTNGIKQINCKVSILGESIWHHKVIYWGNVEDPKQNIYRVLSANTWYPYWTIGQFEYETGLTNTFLYWIRFIHMLQIRFGSRFKPWSYAFEEHLTSSFAISRFEKIYSNKIFLIKWVFCHSNIINAIFISKEISYLKYFRLYFT